MSFFSEVVNNFTSYIYFDSNVKMSKAEKRRT